MTAERPAPDTAIDTDAIRRAIETRVSTGWVYGKTLALCDEVDRLRALLGPLAAERDVALRVLRWMLPSPGRVTIGSPDAPFSVALEKVDPEAAALLARLEQEAP